MDTRPCHVLRATVPGPKTVVVLGAYRGGTSFVAQRLDAIGVPMGQGSGPEPSYRTYEDPQIGHMIAKMQERAREGESNAAEWVEMRRLVAERDLMHPNLWGFKKPGAVLMIDALLPLLRNPHAVVVMRDPVAAWMSSIRHGEDLGWAKCRHHHCVLLDLVEKPRCPTLALSFELARSRPGEVERELRLFLRGERDDSLQQLRLFFEDPMDSG